MALFPTHHPHRHAGNGGGPLVPPELMVRQICHRPARHPYPVAMAFIGTEINNWGQPTAKHRCPACARVRGLVIDFRTGGVRRLYQHD